MAEKVKLILAGPDRVVKEGEFTGVIIPAYSGNLTVIPGRAPSMVWLEPGMVQPLDASWETVDKFFISGGAAEIVNNTCTISAENIIAKKDISVAEALEKQANAADENSKLFYQIIYDELTAFPNK